METADQTDENFQCIHEFDGIHIFLKCDNFVQTWQYRMQGLH